MNPQSISFVARLLLVLLLCVTSLFFLGGILGSSTAQTSEERELEYKIPTHVPIKIKIKKEKEKAIKEIRNEKWLGDFELEVTNTSDKPIYFLELWIILPEIIGENGGVVGMPLRYGRMAFVHHNTLPLPDDVPIRPGEIYTFKIPEKYQIGWYGHKAKGYMTDPKKLQILFVQLSFGDGTGFDRTDAMPYAYNKGESHESSTTNRRLSYEETAAVDFRRFNFHRSDQRYLCPWDAPIPGILKPGKEA